MLYPWCGIFLGGTSGKEPAFQGRRCKRDAGSIPGLGRSPRGGHGNPLQYSCLENPMDRGAWQAMGSHRVRQAWSNLACTQKGMYYWYMQQPGWISKELYWMAQASSKRLHTIWFHLYKVLEMKKKCKWRTDSWLPKVKEGVRVGGKWVRLWKDNLGTSRWR